MKEGIKIAGACAVLTVLFIAIFAVHKTAGLAIEDADQSVKDTTHETNSLFAWHEKPPQFVIFSFDGSKSKSMWEDTRAFAKEMTAKGEPVNFTYFISGVYFVTKDTASVYQAPNQPIGKSAIGYGDNNQDIIDRIDEINAAAAEGNEISSHASGHYSGTSWDTDQWKQELSSLTTLMKDVSKNNKGITPDHMLSPEASAVVGFRAPELGTSAGLYSAMTDLGYRYDASKVGDSKQWPYKKGTVWEFPITSIRLGTNRQWVISMDYSLFSVQTGLVDKAKQGTPQWLQLENDLNKSYTEYFTTNYQGNRAPLYIAGHFSRWNDSLYWEAMKQFAEQVCGMADVHCVTYKTLADFMDTLTPDQVAHMDQIGLPPVAVK